MFKMYHCLLVNQHRHYSADFFKKNYEPILGGIQEPRADEAKNYFVPADLSLGGEGLGFLYRQKKARTTLYVQHVFSPSSFKQNPLVQPEMFQKEKAY